LAQGGGLAGDVDRMLETAREALRSVVV